MDRLILRYHWKQFQDSGIKLAVKKDVASTDISFGMIFSDRSLGYWARFLSYFQAVNDDTQSRIMFDAIESMKEKVCYMSLLNQKNRRLGSPLVLYRISSKGV